MEEKKDVIQESSPEQTEVKEETTETSETVETQETPEVSQPLPEDKDEHGVPWKNRFMEAQRKLQEIPNTIEKTIEEALAKRQTNQTEREYTISELEAFAIQRPDMKPWVEEEKAKIIQRNVTKSLTEQVTAVKTEEKNNQIRMQSEHWVVTHPKFKECFTTDYSGNKVWNTQNPLTNLIGNYLNQTDPTTGKSLSTRPDGIAVAARLAYADYALMNEGKTQKAVGKLKADLRETQKKTLTSGGGVSNPSTGKDALSQAKEELAKTGNAKNAVREYLRKYHNVE